jgi:glucose/arabinose dehydrogenase
MRPLPGVLAVVILLAACGGGGSSGGSGSGDSVAPIAALTAPVDRAAGLTGAVMLSATAADDVGVAGVDFQVDGATVASVATAPYTAAIDTTRWAAGQHVLRARARDAAGNASAWASATVQFANVATLPAGFTLNESWITGLSNATAIAQAPDGRLFVAQQGGALRVVKNGVLLPTPFAQFPVDSSGERGLVGVTLHPQFATTGWVYAYYTSTFGGAHNRIARLTANGDVAAVGSEIDVDLPALGATNHNGGGLKFGADGKLYVGVGENAVPANSQSTTGVLGKVLRLSEDLNIPADNPFFATRTGLARAVWADGLRNPYTLAVDPTSGALFINDVGQNTWEEIDLGAAGANYGWPISEGRANLAGGQTAPLFTYNHAAGPPPGSLDGGFFVGQAIAGGAFYPNVGPFPVEYRGSYFFADYVAGWVGRYDRANNAAYAFVLLTGSPVDMLVGTDGQLYVLTRSAIARISVP